jgi:hypothetical protein
LGFGIEGGIGEAELSSMDCKCARQFHEARKNGCRMITHLYDYKTQEEYVVRKRKLQ